MADIELVIKIDEETYKKCKWKNNGVVGLERWERAIANGTVLPKHGRLCDLDAALKCVDDDSMEDCDAKWQAIRLFDWAMSKRVVLDAWGNKE